MRSAAAATAAIILATTASAGRPAFAAEEAAQQPVFNIMGPADCARWPRRASLDSAAKAVSLNWALGFLSGVAERTDPKLFEMVQPETVGAWLDTYCQAHPTDTLPAAVRVLGAELVAQLPPPPPPMFFTPPAPTAPPPAAAAKAPVTKKAAPRPAARRPADRRAPAPAIRRAPQ